MFFEITNYIGVVAFAISGMLKGLKYRLDIFGVIVLSLITALGGGIIRDMLLNEVPVSLINERDAYLAVITAVISYLFLHNKLEGRSRISKLVMISDALGLAAFAIIGAEKGVNAHLGPFSTAVMATLTGVGGGVIRDLLVSEIPFVLKEDLYAVLCAAGGCLYWFLALADQEMIARENLAYAVFIVLFMIRLIAIKYKLNLPSKFREIKDENDKK
ncbi:trimeric intracellular cation channel family protein [Psychrilyobacter sp.]|uniref:trimeric intracellular cation channel family protein n=1 Tax=Psychrilyobacter sp. TaxID=2586924 RepID=UPI00301763ED